MIVVSNASPLIILAKISYFHLPQRLFNKITISEEVWDEVVVSCGQHSLGMENSLMFS